MSSLCTCEYIPGWQIVWFLISNYMKVAVELNVEEPEHVWLMYSDQQL